MIFRGPHLFLTVLIGLSSGLWSWAQEPHHHDHDHHVHHDHAQGNSGQPLRFVENNGQWNNRIHFRAGIPGGDVWVEGDRLTYGILSDADMKRRDELTHTLEFNRKPFPIEIRGHAFQVKFQGANPRPQIRGEHRMQGYYNYFIGKDPSRWASEVNGYGEVIMADLYTHIDLVTKGDGGQFKYEYWVQPGADASDIRWEYEGVDRLELRDGDLVIHTSVGEIVEKAPYSYQLFRGENKEVPTEYVLVDEKTVTFRFPNGYDKQVRLVIDPTVIASTYTGSTGSQTYGHTSTFDLGNHLYGAGNAFGQGFPSTTGAYSITHGGSNDMGVSKFQPDGSGFLYSTFIGGSGSDYPHSMIVNSLGQLCILGSSSSSNFPVTSTAFDTSYNGQRDIVIAILNNGGTGLVGSTYLGGTGSDGFNILPGNYGDSYKGEINLDDNDNIYIASFTQSIDFPGTTGTVQDTLAGDQDGVISKLNSNLSSLEWATYIGTPTRDATYSVKIGDNGKIFVAGSAGDGLPTTTGAAFPTYQGGDQDAFMARLSNDGTTIERLTYFGSPLKDQGFFVELDKFGDPFLLGQSNGGISSSVGAYSGFNGGSFVIKLDQNLTTVDFTSTFGLIAPTAFLVDNCNNIYAAGHGGLSPLNQNNYETTFDAIDSTSGGFYIIVLEPNATGLLYATFYGNSSAHVDGGTSRFDKRGVIYEAVCSSSGSPTTPWALVQTATAAWDLYLFKIDLEQSGAVANAAAAPDISGCVPFTVQFDNVGSTGVTNFWDFDDNGATSSNGQPIHTYNDTGTYNVMYVTIDSLSCNIADTAFVTVYVSDTLSFDLPDDSTVCDSTFIYDPGLPPNATYLWSTGAVTPTILVDTSGIFWVEVSRGNCSLSDTIDLTLVPSIEADLGPDSVTCETSLLLDPGGGFATYLWSTNDTTQTLTVDTTGLYSVTVTQGMCFTTDTVSLQFAYPPSELGSDTAVCGDSLLLDAGPNGSVFYQWSTNDSTQSITVDTTGQYWVVISNGMCENIDTINVTLQQPVPLDLGPDTFACVASYVLDAGPGAGFTWSTNETTQMITVTSPGTYWVMVDDGVCSSTDTIELEFPILNVDLGGGGLFCDVSFVTLDAGSPGATYLWSTNATTQTITVVTPGTYSVLVDNGQCTDADTATISFGQSPPLRLGVDRYLCTGQEIFVGVEPIPNVNYQWSTNDSITPLRVNTGGSYVLDATLGGCTTRDTVIVTEIEANEVVLGEPNVFTPNNDGLNDCFRPILAGDIHSYELKIFNRWGTQVFESGFPGVCWDGRTFQGRMLEDGVYFWIANYVSACEPGVERTAKGNLTLLR